MVSQPSLVRLLDVETLSSARRIGWLLKLSPVTRILIPPMTTGAISGLWGSRPSRWQRELLPCVACTL
uniref:Uncharacterized protein n=1 Tax=Takifugu rubripes TaxID=31033 RepID=A0A674NJL2_TAKRU